METMKQFSGNEEGQGLVEYVLIISLISIAAVISMGLMGNEIMDLYNFIKNSVVSLI